MKHFKVRLSLRVKLLFLLVSLPLISLGLYLAMAMGLFQEDKIAYVYDSSAAVSRSLATQTRMEVQTAYANFRTVAESYEMAGNDFNPAGKEFFNKNPRMQAILMLRRQPDGTYKKLGEIAKESEPAQGFMGNSQLIEKTRADAIAHTVILKELSGTPGLLLTAFRLGEIEDSNHMVVMGLYQDDDLVNAFQSSGNYASFVITRSGAVAVGSLDVVDSDLDLLKPILAKSDKDGVAQTLLSDGATYLISYANVGLGNLVVVSRVDKNKALKAVEVLLAKSVLFFIVLLASTLLISIFASNQLTSQLRELFEATKKVAQGDFNIRVTPKSSDEVGGLAESFNWMAAEVARLLTETAEKARMESELSTVRTVQETLFPEAQSQFGPISIAGHFEPASECGGDWWSYSRVGNKIFLWIGDATGHGAPAALITSAARSASAVIESLPDMTPGVALSILNRAIHQTSKGQIMMTFFVGSIDLDAQKFTYASASHDPPYFMRRSGDKLVKKDLIPLNEVNGPRLGESKDFIYEDISLDFAPGDMIFFYTDGILDVQDPAGKKWGERTFLKTLVDHTNTGANSNARLEGVKKTMNDFRRGSVLIDDVTMIMCEYEKSAA